MQLMTIVSAKEMVEKYKSIYPDSYQDIYILVASKHIKKDDKLFTLGAFEKQICVNFRYPNWTEIRIDGMSLLDEYDLEDSSQINIHVPINELVI